MDPPSRWACCRGLAAEPSLSGAGVAQLADLRFWPDVEGEHRGTRAAQGAATPAAGIGTGPATSTASRAGSPGIRGRACPGTRTRTRTKPAEPPAAPEEAGEHDPDKHKDTASAGTPHVLIIRTPDGLLTWLQALGSRRKADVGAGIPAAFSGLLMTDGYTGYQHLLSRLAGIQQCCQPPGTKTGRPHRIMVWQPGSPGPFGAPASQDNVLLAQQERFRAGSSGAAAWPGRRSGSARRYGRPRW